MLNFVRSEGRADVYRVSAPTLDLHNAQAFRSGVAPAARNVRIVILDLSQVRFIDSAGIAALLGLVRSVGEAGGTVKLASPTPEVRSILQLVRMHRIVDLYNDVDEIFRELRARPAAA